MSKAAPLPAVPTCINSRWLRWESSVEPSALPDKGTWYRVRIGPYTKLDEINQVRQTLAQNGINASLVKLKDPSNTKAN